ncbi:hypothetical protein QYF36_013012 [Acer negundo]|nr:hypothetical protein QYF36_013012 [Acer negundo]
MTRGWHPVTYKYSDVTPMPMQSMKEIDNIYYETEYRREWCSNKGKPSACFLFARKFTRPTALRLLNMASLVPSKLPLVKKPSDLHSGVGGAILKVDKKKPLVIVNKVDYALFTVDHLPLSPNVIISLIDLYVSCLIFLNLALL